MQYFFADLLPVAKQEIADVETDAEGEDVSQNAAADGQYGLRDDAEAFLDEFAQAGLNDFEIAPPRPRQRVLPRERKRALHPREPRGDVDAPFLKRLDHVQRLFDDDAADHEGGQNHGEHDEEERGDGRLARFVRPLVAEEPEQRLEHDRGQRRPQDRLGEWQDDHDRKNGDESEEQDEPVAIAACGFGSFHDGFAPGSNPTHNLERW